MPGIASEKETRKLRGILSIPELLLGLLLCAALVYLQHRNYLFFHALAEIFSISIAVALFTLAWATRKTNQNGALHLLGASALSIALLDLIHTLSYQGMGVFSSTRAADQATQLWIGARGIQAIALLVAPLVARRRLHFAALSFGIAALAAVMLASIFAWDIFPHAFNATDGLTAFKIGAEYAIILGLAAAGLLFYYHRERFEPITYYSFLVAIVLTIASEFSFTLYTDPQGPANALGHFFKILAAFFLFRALFESSVYRPAKTLYHNLIESRQQLADTNQQLIGMFEHAPAGMALFDGRKPYRVIAHNKVYQQFWDEPWRSRGMVDAHISDYAPHADDAGIFDLFQEVVHSGAGKTFFSFRYDHLDRGTTWWNWTLSPILDERGHTRSFVHMLIDVTQETRARQDMRHALRRVEESERHFRAIADTINQIVWMTDAHGEFVWFNTRWHEFTGMKPDGQPDAAGWRERIHPDHRPRVLANWEQAKRAGEQWEDTFPMMDRGGQYRWFLSRAQPVHDTNGALIQWIGASTDIHDRKTMEEQIREVSRFPSEDPHPVLRFSKTGEILYANQAAVGLLSMWSVAAGGVIGDPWKSRIRDAFASGRQSTFEAQCGDQTISLTIVPVQNSYVNMYGSDVTERNKYERSLRKHSEQLAEANRELESFAYSVSHDLRNPLHTMLIFVDLLNADCADKLGDDGLEYVGHIEDACTRMNQLIGDILNLSRIGRQEMTLGPVNIGALAHSALSDLRRADPDRQVRISVGEELGVTGDEHLLDVAVRNLLKNAWKYTRKQPDPLIEVDACTHDGMRCFFVRDNGAGFDMSRADELFVPFKRLHADADFPGSGVGLAITARAIARHGGKIWAQSESGKGATFYFSLPAD